MSESGLMTAPTIREVSIPGVAADFSLDLPADLVRPRAKALELQRQSQPGLPDRTLIDAQSWQRHTADEDWLIWRARRCAARLGGMPIDIEEGERLVGRPLFRHPGDADSEALEQARAVLADMPPYPGGDAGHFHPDYETLLTLGIDGLLARIQRGAQQAESTDARLLYEACGIALRGLKTYIERTARSCEERGCQAAGRHSEWQDLADICRRVSSGPPATFHEALQLMFVTEMALWFGEDHGLTCPGRIDRTLWRFYRDDLDAGRIDARGAFELLCCLYIQLNRVLWPGSAVAVMVGGRDRRGRPVANDLTYLALAAREATRLVYPTVGLAWNCDLPPALTDYAVDMLATGVGDPAFFNDDLIAAGLANHGVREEDCYDYMNSTCVEIKVCGASNMWVTQPYFNCAQALLDVLEDASEKQSYPDTFAEFRERVKSRLAEQIGDAARRLDEVWSRRAEHGCFPLASCLIADCLERGRDFDRGGARYNWVENSFVGLANLVDSLLAVRQLVYTDRVLKLDRFHAILKSDFADSEPLRQRILNTLPKYGNDREEADHLAVDMADFLIQTTGAHRVGLHRYVPGFFCWVMHERMGSNTGATPDGRRSGLPLADGAGAAQGRENRGPSASVLSTTKWSHRDVLGGLVHNVKFSRSMLNSPGARLALRQLIETYLARGGFEIQVNVVGSEVLRDAQEHPEAYRDLLVRVAGYSDYFVHLNRKQQDEVIQRTEHQL